MRSVSGVLCRESIYMMMMVPQESFFPQSRFQATDSVGFTADLALNFGRNTQTLTCTTLV
jgi:hypothetical protein